MLQQMQMCAVNFKNNVQFAFQFRQPDYLMMTHEYSIASHWATNTHTPPAQIFWGVGEQFICTSIKKAMWPFLYRIKNSETTKLSFLCDGIYIMKCFPHNFFCSSLLAMVFCHQVKLAFSKCISWCLNGLIFNYYIAFS